VFDDRTLKKGVKKGAEKKVPKKGAGFIFLRWKIGK